jgi:hypothetical protein
MAQAVTLLSYVPDITYIVGSGYNASELCPEVAYIVGSGGNASELCSWNSLHC